MTTRKQSNFGMVLPPLPLLAALFGGESTPAAGRPAPTTAPAADAPTPTPPTPKPPAAAKTPPAAEPTAKRPPALKDPSAPPAEPGFLDSIANANNSLAGYLGVPNWAPAAVGLPALGLGAYGAYRAMQPDEDEEDEPKVALDRFRKNASANINRLIKQAKTANQKVGLQQIHQKLHQGCTLGEAIQRAYPQAAKRARDAMAKALYRALQRA